MSIKYYNKEGKVVSLVEWAKLMEDTEYRRVRLDILPRRWWIFRGYRVSTVLLGLDHNWGDGPPLLFETMVFKGGSSGGVDMDRYSTLKEAIDGHEEMVRKWRHR